jgi:methionyl-tRNA formyltransferase
MLSCFQDLTVEKLTPLEPDWIFFPHWSWFIPPAVHEKYTCVIFHMTDLPYGRGGSPLQNLIIRGHSKTKLSALKCVNEVDAGPIYTKRDLLLHGTAEDILKRSSVMIEEMIEWIVVNDPTPVDQVGNIVNFKRRGRDDGNIASLTDLDLVYDYIRMLDADGYPRAFIETSNFAFEFSQAKNSGDYVEAQVKIKHRKYD